MRGEKEGEICTRENHFLQDGNEQAKRQANKIGVQERTPV